MNFNNVITKSIPVQTEKAAYSNEFIKKNQYWTLSYIFSIFNPNSFISLCQGAQEEVLNKKGFSNDFRFSEIVFCTLHFVFPRRKSSFQVCSNIWPFRKISRRSWKVIEKKINFFCHPQQFKILRFVLDMKMAEKKTFLFFPTWLIGFVINLSFPFPTFCNENFAEAKAIKELNQDRGFCDWLTSHIAFAFASPSPAPNISASTLSSEMCAPTIYSIQTFFLFPSLFCIYISGVDCKFKLAVWGGRCSHCWFNLHHAIM